MAGYATRVKRDIARWLEAGLIDAATAGRLSGDIERNGRRISFGSVLAMMAAALFSAAILIFIAANWEAIPRLGRVGLLFVLILGGYVGGAMLKLRGHSGYAEAAWIVAAASFGGAIALIGQMYHLSGDEKQAIFAWGVGTAFAAAAFRSGPLTVAATLLGSAWMILHATSGWAGGDLPASYLLVAAALWLLSFLTRSRAARHLILLSLYLFALFFYWKTQTVFAPVLLVCLSAALFAYGHQRPIEAERYSGLGSGLAVQALIGFLAGVAILQVVSTAFLGSLLAFAGIITALLLEGRENSALRWLAYGAFILQLGYVYIAMLGTMLGTAGFFVFGGLSLSGLAWLIARLERRIAGPPLEGGASP